MISAGKYCRKFVCLEVFRTNFIHIKKRLGYKLRERFFQITHVPCSCTALRAVILLATEIRAASASLCSLSYSLGPVEQSYQSWACHTYHMEKLLIHTCIAGPHPSVLILSSELNLNIGISNKVSGNDPLAEPRIYHENTDVTFTWWFRKNIKKA